jgi:predicted  nucleic acid-binding Zn-ribbon protein
MTEQRRTALKELQTLDKRIQDARKRIQDFDPLFEEVEEPALILGSELETARNRSKEMKLEERRLESSIEEKRTRQQRLDERLGSVRNLREEAAVSAELEMVKRALQNDEQEAYTLLDQIRKVEERLSDLDAALSEAQALVEPKREDLLTQRAAAEKELAALEAERKSFAAGMEPIELKTYEAIRGGGRRVAVAELTRDGACGHCFSMVPLQLQNEIRHGAGLIRCEACGVILAAAEPEAADEGEARGGGASSANAEAANGSDSADDGAANDGTPDEVLVQE